MYRRLGWGAGPGELPTLCRKGAAGALKALLRPDVSKIPAAPANPWEGLDLVADMDGEKRGELANTAAARLLQLFVSSPRPVMERMAWFWHGHLVSSLREVNQPELMARQFRLYRQLGLGSFPEIVRQTVIDAAMLEYLDGKSSTKKKPNENLSRELKELFTLGVGHYTEADVQAGAKALTGWVIGPPPTLTVEFRPTRHDDTPQTYLGVAGVHDADGVVGAIMASESMPPFIVGKITREILGPNATSSDIDKAARVFHRSTFDINALVTHLAGRLALGVDRGPVVLSPVRWFVEAMRATGSTYDVTKARADLDASGQLPFWPPNVGGWPSGAAWLSTSATVARLNLAARIAESTPETGAARAAAAAGDWSALSVALGLPADFPASTRGVLAKATTWPDRLVLALTSPEFVLS